MLRPSRLRLPPVETAPPPVVRREGEKREGEKVEEARVSIEALSGGGEEALGLLRGWMNVWCGTWVPLGGEERDEEVGREENVIGGFEEGGAREFPEIDEGSCWREAGGAVAIRFAWDVFESRERIVVGFVEVEERTVW
jgi:hypothetical protein